MKTPLKFTRLSPNDGHYVHGFYNLQPWSTDHQRFLCHRLPFADRMPTGSESAEIGWIEISSGRFCPLAETLAWNFQLGSMLQWLDENRVIYNTRKNDAFVARVHSLVDDSIRDLPSTFFAIAPSGGEVLGFDMARGAAVNPGYCYTGTNYPLFDRSAPEGEGIVCMDTSSGASRLLASYKELADRFAGPSWQREPVMIGRILYNADGSRAVFSFRFWMKETRQRHTVLIVLSPRTGAMAQLLPNHWSPAHFDWLGKDHLLVWCQPEEGSAARFHLVSCIGEAPVPIAGSKLTVDGHVAFCRQGSAILTDTFRQKDGNQHLMLYERETDQLTHLARFPAPSRPTDLRCDLHPCLSRDERLLAVDSFHEPFRGIYAARLE